MIHNYKGQQVSYEVVRGQRKTIVLQLRTDGCLVVKGPKTMKDAAIGPILEGKWSWIIAKKQAMKDAWGDRVERRYEDKETFQILGRSLEIVIHRQALSYARLKKMKDQWVVVVPGGWSKDQVKAFIQVEFKRVLKAYLEDRLGAYADHYQKKVNRITVRDQSTKWGSCSSKGNLNFNYRLIFAPLSVLDYLLVHEMTHLDHMNHSKAYWDKVSQVMDDYETKDKWLKTHGHHLSMDYKPC